VLFAMTRKHSTTIAWADPSVHETARYCTISLVYIP
jgi:hypothetical protein